MVNTQFIRNSHRFIAACRPFVDGRWHAALTDRTLSFGLRFDPDPYRGAPIPRPHLTRE